MNSGQEVSADVGKTLASVHQGDSTAFVRGHKEMGNPARQLGATDGPEWPPNTPEAKLKEKLYGELHGALVDLSKLQDGWDGPGSVSPGAEQLKSAARLAHIIIGFSNPMPRALNMSCSQDGEVLFTVYGGDGREVDLWINDASGSMRVVPSEAGKVLDPIDLKIEDCRKVTEWLARRAPRI
jgi:hypothetical protein